MVEYLAKGINRLTRSQTRSKRTLYKRKTPKVAKKQTKVEEKEAKFYPAEDVQVKKANRKVQKPTKLRASITPGTVLVLLAGNFAGRRVVFLKQLESGLLLVTGPKKYNGVALRRVNQSYVIATSTKVQLPELKKLDQINDKFFLAATAKKEKEFFEGEAKKKAPVDAAKKALQKEIDEAVCSSVKKQPMLASYLRSLFTLQKGQAPHEMKF